MPYLPSREDLDPKRNRAREKLSHLSLLYLKDLASDVRYELCRRFPMVGTFRENVEYGLNFVSLETISIDLLFIKCSTT